MLVTVFLTGANAQDCNVTLPFTDSFEAAELNPCWTVILADTSTDLPQYAISEEASSDGLQSLGFAPYWNPDYDLYLITPELPVSGTKMVSFDHKGYFSAETFVVGYSTTTADPSAFIWGDEVSSPAVDYPWNHYQNVSIPGNAKYIAIHYAGGIILFIDNFVVDVVSSCMAPVDLLTSNVTATSADLSWTQTSSNLDITLLYASSADTNVHEIPSVTLTNGIYTFSPLLENTTYSWMLGVICDGDTLFSEVNTFTTPCTPLSTLPYVEDFDSAAVYDLPDCWRNADPSEQYPRVSTLNPHSGHSMEFSVSFFTNSSQYAIMPAFSTDLSDLQLTFWTRRGNASSGTFHVGYVTDLNDMSSFVEVWSTTAAEIGDNNYHNYLVVFENAPATSNTTGYITFRYDAAEYSNWFLDDVTVELVPACALPDGLTVNDVTENSAGLSWTGDVDEYVLYYKVSGTSAWTEVTAVSLDDSTYTLSGLTPNTTYQWYVAAVCGDTLVNSFSTASFTTQCSVFVSPYSESFAAAALPDCWARYSGSADSALTETSDGWSFGNAQVLGSGHATLNIAGSDCRYWLVSPVIDLNGLSTPALTFDLALTGHNSSAAISDSVVQTDDRFMVLVSTDDGETWDVSNAVVWSNETDAECLFNGIPSVGQTVTLPLVEYYNETVRIAFYGESTADGGDNDLHIDNVLVTEMPSCLAPSLLTVTGTTASTASVTWNENGDAVSWIVEYGPAGFMPGDGQEITVNSTSSVTISNLQDLTDYDVYVSAICGPGQFSDPVVGTFQTKLAPVALPYSTDFGTTSDRHWQLNNGSCSNFWTMGATDIFPNALFVTHDSIAPGYLIGNHVSLVSAVKNLIVGDNSEIKVSFDVMVGGEGMFDFIKLFLAPDTMEYPASNTVFNMNHAAASYSAFAYDFSDYLYLSTYHSYVYKFNLTDSNIVHVDAVMPNPNSNATAASTAKLVFLWRNDNSGGTQPGAIISNVSVSAVTCAKPVSVSVNDITDSSVVVTWLHGGTETAWNVEYRPASSTSWTTVPVATTSCTLIGLAPSTQYVIRVQTDCGGGDVSAYSSVTFITDSTEVPTVMTLPAENITEEGAMLRGVITNPDNVTITSKGFVWNPSLNVDSVVFVADNSDTLFYTLTGLLPATTYTYSAFVEFDGTIVYGDELTFTTQSQSVEPCETPTDLHQEVTQSGEPTSSVQWTDVAGASQWNVQYALENAGWTTETVSTTSFQIPELQYNTTYHVRVQAVCDNDETSDWTEIISVMVLCGVEDWLENSVTLFPNPANNVVNVQCTMSNVQGVEVFDVYGKLVNTVGVCDTPVQTRINVNGLADGMYFVRVTTDRGVVTKSFVVKR